MDYRTEPLIKYFDDASAAKPTPGGGSVAAMAAALATTMASMAAGFTVGKEKFKDVEPEVREILKSLADAREAFFGLAHRDMDAYSQIMSAYRLPKDTEEEKTKRGKAIQEATAKSLDLVMDVLGRCEGVLKLVRRLVEISNPNLLSDVGVAAELMLGAHQAAAINVQVNLQGLKDEKVVKGTRKKMADSTRDAKRLAQETTGIVSEHLAGG